MVRIFRPRRRCRPVAAAQRLNGIQLAAGAGNTLSANDAVGLLLGPGTYTGTTVQGNQITGGTFGIIGRGVLSNSQVLGNAISGVQSGIVLVDARGSTSATPFRVGNTTTTTGTGVTYTTWFRNVRNVSNAGNVFIYPSA